LTSLRVHTYIGAKTKQGDDENQPSIGGNFGLGPVKLNPHPVRVVGVFLDGRKTTGEDVDPSPPIGIVGVAYVWVATGCFKRKPDDPTNVPAPSVPRGRPSDLADV
jgi:hypothetical protein